MKTIVTAAALLGFSLCAETLHAKTFTYDFAMPAFQQWEDIPGQSLVGRTSILRLQLDNGTASNRDQTYGLSNIRAAQIVTVEGTSLSTDLLGIQFPGFGIPGFANDAALISTNSQGQALLDTNQPGLAAITFGNFPTVGIQLAAAWPERGAIGPCTYSITINGNSGYRCVEHEIFQAIGTLAAPAPVPLPSAAGLLLTCLGAMFGLRKRRKLL